MRLLTIIFMLVLANLPVLAKNHHDSSDQKPEWLTKGEYYVNSRRTNDSYYFKIVKVSANNLAECRSQRVEQLSTHIGQSNKISGTSQRQITTLTDGQTTSTDEFKLTYTNDIDVTSFYAKFIDDYWETVHYGNGVTGYDYYALFAVSNNDYNTNFDRFETTSQYGFAPVAMSIIPGIGQWYKGSKVKGLSFMCAEALSIGAIIWTENERASYKKKSIEQPKFAKEYSSKAANWETGRNISIGIAAGIWVYNIIDAAVAKGSKRLVISKSRGERLSIVPFATPYSTGISCSLQF